MLEMEIDLKMIIAAQSKKFVREFSKVVMFLENALIPEDRISNTPSVMDGLSPDCENDLRILGCEMIQTAGILLNLPQVSMATGQVLFQRFFYSKSFVKHNYEIVAMACINLASKIEEAPRRVRDVANVFHHIKQIKNKKSISPMILDANYVELKNHVIKSERRILKELGFAVHVKHPHKIIVMFLQVLECEKNQHLIQCAWNYMNDSFRTNVFVRFTPESIAAACIYLAARQLKICLPNRPHWFLLFGITEENIRTICRQILQLYTRMKPNVDELDAKMNELRSRLVEQKLKEKQERVDAREATLTDSNTANNSPQTKKSLETNEKSRHKRSRSRSRTPTAYKKSKRGNTKHNSRNRDKRSSSNSNRSSSNHRLPKRHSPSSVARLVHQKFLKSSHRVHCIVSQKSPKKNSPSKINGSKHSSYERSKDKHRTDKVSAEKNSVFMDKYEKYRVDKIISLDKNLVSSKKDNFRSDRIGNSDNNDKHDKYIVDKSNTNAGDKNQAEKYMDKILSENKQKYADKIGVNKMHSDKYDKYKDENGKKLDDKFKRKDVKSLEQTEIDLRHKLQLKEYKRQEKLENKEEFERTKLGKQMEGDRDRGKMSKYSESEHIQYTEVKYVDNERPKKNSQDIFIVRNNDIVDLTRHDEHKSSKKKKVPTATLR